MKLNNDRGKLFLRKRKGGGKERDQSGAGPGECGPGVHPAQPWGPTPQFCVKLLCNGLNKEELCNTMVTHRWKDNTC